MRSSSCSTFTECSPRRLSGPSLLGPDELGLSVWSCPGAEVAVAETGVDGVGVADVPLPCRPTVARLCGCSYWVSKILVLTLLARTRL